ncbi:MAG: carbon-nitrogen hydrolase family protein [bacterium]
MATVRISAAAFRAGPARSFDDFADHCARLVSQAAAEQPDFLVFPELFTAELLNFSEEPDLVRKFTGLARHTADYVSLFRGLASKHGFHVVAGSHLKEAGGKLYNTGYLFSPDGQVMEQRKCHLFPVETAWTSPGDRLEVFETGKARVSILICYDLEFPEASRLVTLMGAEILFSPSATLDEQGYWRVRHCGHARSVEDQVYVAHCSLLGEVAGLPFWGMSSILTPCDLGFPLKGIAVESPPNVETIVTAELDTERLYEVRRQGAATTLEDRRPDMIEGLYAMEMRRQAPAKAERWK